MAWNSSIDYLWFFLSVYITVASDQRDSIKLCSRVISDLAEEKGV